MKTRNPSLLFLLALTSACIGSLAVAQDEDTPFKLGPVGIRPTFTLTFSDDDGVGQQQASSSQTFSPTFFMEIGNQWNLDYTPLWRYYGNDSFEDTLDHTVVLAGEVKIEDWRLTFNQDYTFAKPSLVETGQQTSQQTWGTKFGAIYQMNQKMTLDIGLNQDFNYTDQFSDSREWSTMNWLRYSVSQEVTMSGGLGYGYIDIDPGANIEYKKAMGGLQWTPSEKLSFSLDGGVDIRRTSVSGSKFSTHPTYNLTFDYNPVETSTISLTSSHSFSSSLFQNFATETTSLNASIRQRLLGRFFVTASIGQDSIVYDDAANVGPITRKDNLDTYEVGISTTLLKKINLAANYRHRENDSNQNAFAFDSNFSSVTATYSY